MVFNLTPEKNSFFTLKNLKFAFKFDIVEHWKLIKRSFNHFFEKIL